jgi:hypothetical protein
LGKLGMEISAMVAQWALPFMSPRGAGNIAYGLGRAAKPFGMAEPYALPAYQLGRVSEQAEPPRYATGGSIYARGGAGMGNMTNGGMLRSDVPGRTDALNVDVPSGAYVIPADIVAGEGQGNSEAGAQKFQRMFTTAGPLGMKTLKRGRGPMVGHASRIGTTRLPKGAKISATRQTFAAGGSLDDMNEGQPTPIQAAGGEFIVAPEIVRQIGKGDLKQGHRLLDAFVLYARKQHLRQIKNLKPPVKS